MNRKDFMKGAAGAVAMTALFGGGMDATTAVAEETIEAKVQHLLDREAIKECQYRYARGCDLQDAELLASAFDETISVDYPTGTKVADVPGAGMAQGIVGNFIENNYTTQHYMNVYEIKIDGDTATALVYLRATHKKPDVDFWILGGYYENSYVRTENGWKIKTVKLTTVYEEGEAYTG